MRVVLKEQNNKKAADNVFGGLEAKSKVQMKYWKVKIKGLHYA